VQTGERLITVCADRRETDYTVCGGGEWLITVCADMGETDYSVCAGEIG